MWRCSVQLIQYVCNPNSRLSPFKQSCASLMITWSLSLQTFSCHPVVGPLNWASQIWLISATWSCYKKYSPFENVWSIILFCHFMYRLLRARVELTQYTKLTFFLALNRQYNSFLCHLCLVPLYRIKICKELIEYCLKDKNKYFHVMCYYEVNKFSTYLT